MPRAVAAPTAPHSELSDGQARGAATRPSAVLDRVRRRGADRHRFTRRRHRGRGKRQDAAAARSRFLRGLRLGARPDPPLRAGHHKSSPRRRGMDDQISRSATSPPLRSQTPSTAATRAKPRRAGERRRSHATRCRCQYPTKSGEVALRRARAATRRVWSPLDMRHQEALGGAAPQPQRATWTVSHFSALSP